MKPHHLYKRELKRCKKPILFVSRYVIEDDSKVVAGCIWSKGWADYYIWDDKAPEIPLAQIFPNYIKLEIFDVRSVTSKFGKKFSIAFPWYANKTVMREWTTKTYM